MYIFMSS